MPRRGRRCWWEWWARPPRRPRGLYSRRAGSGAARWRRFSCHVKQCMSGRARSSFRIILVYLSIIQIPTARRARPPTSISIFARRINQRRIRREAPHAPWIKNGVLTLNILAQKILFGMRVPVGNTELKFCTMVWKSTGLKKAASEIIYFPQNFYLSKEFNFSTLDKIN